MNGATVADLGLVLPELILTGMALVLILVARRIQSTSVPVVATVLAAAAAVAASWWVLSKEPQSAFGGLITVDGYAQFFKVLVAAALALVALLSVKGLEGSGAPRSEYHVLLLLASVGMMLTVSAVDMVTFYLGLELITLCSYILVGITVDRPLSNEAAIKYFLLASFASALMLFGISITYGLTGTTSFSEVAASIAERGLADDPLQLAALALIAAGLAFKIGAVPFHSWVPDAYQGASTPVAAFLASGSKAAGLAALGRVVVIAFGPDSPALSIILVGLAALSVAVGSVLVLAQTDMKRLLAYSSIAHVGYAVMGLTAGTDAGASATMTYAFFYVFMTLGAFGVVIGLGARGATLDGYQGLASQRPGVAGVMLLFLLALTGIPLTSGFVAKFVVISSAVGAGYVALAVLAVVCSVVSAFVYMRIAVLMYMREPESPTPARFPVALSVAIAIAAIVTLVGGVLPRLITDWAVAP